MGLSKTSGHRSVIKPVTTRIGQGRSRNATPIVIARASAMVTMEGTTMVETAEATAIMVKEIATMVSRGDAEVEMAVVVVATGTVAIRGTTAVQAITETDKVVISRTSSMT